MVTFLDRASLFMPNSRLSFRFEIDVLKLDPGKSRPDCGVSGHRFSRNAGCRPSAFADL
jgi:hypothetical protein